MKVLALDDEESLRILLCDNLEFAGIETVQASSGKQALELVKKENPALAIVDIGLPDMTGWDVCQRIREDPHSKDLPIIVLSGSTGNEAASMTKAHRVQHLISKPYDCSALVDLVKKILKK